MSVSFCVIWFCRSPLPLLRSTSVVAEQAPPGLSNGRHRADVLETLHKLKQNGYSLAVMSNTTNQIMDWHLKKLENLFDDRLVAEDTKCYKPNLMFFKMSERKFNLKMQEHCHIAKGYWWDIVPAKKMGWNKIWVNRSHLSHGRNTESPYLTISTLSELPQI